MARLVWQFVTEDSSVEHNYHRRIFRDEKLGVQREDISNISLWRAKNQVKSYYRIDGDSRIFTSENELKKALNERTRKSKAARKDSIGAP